MRSLTMTLAFGALGLGVLAGPAEADAADLFTTIGITRSETRQNSQINGNPPYSLPGEEMPPSGTVGVPPDDAQDEVPLRMPDTTGTKPNLAEFRGQTLALVEADQKNFQRLHFFGTTADGSGGGTFTLSYDTGPDQTVAVSFADWCGSATLPTHIAIGPMTRRWRVTGEDGARCSIYHVALDNPAPTRKLVSVTLPPATSGGGTATRAYLMALTLEEAGGSFEMPDLTGTNQFPNDDDAPESDVTVEPGEPSASGWYTTAPRITIRGTDETGGSGVDQIQYRINNGTPQLYSGPFNLTTEGELTLELPLDRPCRQCRDVRGDPAQGRRHRAHHLGDDLPGERRRRRLARQGGDGQPARRRRPGLGHRTHRVPSRGGRHVAALHRARSISAAPARRSSSTARRTPPATPRRRRS